MAVTFAYKISKSSAQRNRRRVDSQSMRNYHYQNISDGPNELPAALQKHPGTNYTTVTTTPHVQRFSSTLEPHPMRWPNPTARPPNEKRTTTIPEVFSITRERLNEAAARTSACSVKYLKPRDNVNFEVARFQRNSTVTQSPDRVRGRPLFLWGS